jgi:sugar lactone lactonase YvrE
MRVLYDDGLSALLRGPETKLCTGFWFTEGPVWVPWDGALLFSDIHGSTTYRWRPGSSHAEIYRRPSWHGNGMTLDDAGNVLTCEHSGRRVSRIPYGGGLLTVVADRFEGKRLNSPNDLAVHRSGALFFTDPPFGFTAGRDGGLAEGDPTAVRELDFQGVFRADPDGTVTCVARDFIEPNGLAFSPDESILYVDDSKGPTIRSFRVNDDLSLSGGEVFVDMSSEHSPGEPDGMKVDIEGRIWCTGPGGVWVIDPDGRPLGIFELDGEHAANLCFGGADYSRLFLTADTSVYAMETNARGLAPGARQGV